HRVRVILRTAEPMVQEFVRELLVNYELPRPTIKTPAPLPRVVDKAEYRLQAEVLPGEGQATEIRLVHRHNNKDLLTDKAMETKAATKIDRMLKLEPGVNQVRIIARSKDADPTEVEFLAVEVLFKTPRPAVMLTGVEPLPD